MNGMCNILVAVVIENFSRYENNKYAPIFIYLGARVLGQHSLLRAELAGGRGVPRQHPQHHRRRFHQPIKQEQQQVIIIACMVYVHKSF